jgi:hypothetical protein
MDQYGDEPLNEAIDQLIAHMARVEPDLLKEEAREVIAETVGHLLRDVGKVDPPFPRLSPGDFLDYADLRLLSGLRRCLYSSSCRSPYDSRWSSYSRRAAVITPSDSGKEDRSESPAGDWSFADNFGRPFFGERL